MDHPTDNLVTVHVKLTVDGSDIEGGVAVPAGPSPRRLLLPVLQSLTNTVVSLAEHAANERGKTVSCARGCAACCRQMVPISPTEAHHLAALVGGMDPEPATVILERFDAALDALKAAAILPRLLRRAKLDSAELDTLDRDYFLANIPCPFLEPDGACGIHADRPLACREYLVTSPPEFCAHPVPGRVRRLELGAKVSLALVNTDYAGWLPLVLARQFVADHPEKLCESPPEELGRILRALV